MRLKAFSDIGYISRHTLRGLLLHFHIICTTLKIKPKINIKWAKVLSEYVHAYDLYIGRNIYHFCKYNMVENICSIRLMSHFFLAACDCNVLGAENLVCNKTNGQCPCRANVAQVGDVTDSTEVADRKCSSCVSGAFGFDLGLFLEPIIILALLCITWIYS